MFMDVVWNSMQEINNHDSVFDIYQQQFEWMDWKICYSQVCISIPNIKLLTNL